MLCGQAPVAATCALTKRNRKRVMIMSTQTLEAFPSSAPTVTDGPRVFGILEWWLKAIDRIRGRIRRRRELTGLVALDDRLLADIGITREQADAARKAFWI
jgi:uncharacterized protein YjiS (DUF1127 family)